MSLSLPAWQGRNGLRFLSEHPAKWMLWEGEPGSEMRERLAGMGIEGVVYDPCGHPPHQGDFLAVMRQNVQNLRRAFQ